MAGGTGTGPSRRTRCRVRGRVGLMACVALLACLIVPEAEAVIVPPGFTDQLVTVVPRPLALAWTPDGRMLIATHAGFVRVYQNGALVGNPALDLRSKMCRSNEWGMNGMAVDPDFANNHFVYIYYTFNKFGNACPTDDPASPVNRVSRFVISNNNVIDPLSEDVVLDGIPDPDGYHAGGDIAFGKDGYLYINTGDGGCDFRGDSGCYLLNDTAQDLGALSGKVLRVTPDGNIPASNPFQGPDSVPCNPNGFTTIGQKCQEIFAYGLRNPFRGAFDPNAADTRMFANDVGQDTWEEINDIQPGGNYGWNVREGSCAPGSSTDCGPPPAGMTNPIYSYNHSIGCTSVTAGDFTPNGLWPATYDNSYMYGDLTCGKLFTLKPDGSGGYTSTEFASGITALIDGVFGPNGSSQAFYYMSWLTFPNDEIHRIIYTGLANRPPTAMVSADRTAGAAPLTVNFNGSASSDPDDDPITFDWDFGDGTPHSGAEQPSHTYTTVGNYTATLTVTDSHGATDSRSVQITVGNDPPIVSIDDPAPSHLYKVGETLTLTGSAEDAEDGTLPNSALTWRVEKHHDTHTHPFLPDTSGNYVPITAPPPEDLLAATNSYLQIYLTATDSDGVSTTVERDIFPHKVNVTFQTNIPGFTLEVAGSPITTSQTVVSWENWGMVANAPDQPDPQGLWWVFDHWSDGGARQHTIVTPATPATYQAYYNQFQYPRPGGASPLKVPLVPEFGPCQFPNAQHIAPLVGGSCTPPVPGSPLIGISSVGRGSGRVRFEVINGNPATPADEADVHVVATISDVSAKTSGSPDYTGKLILRSYLQITDRNNGSSGWQPATGQGFFFGVPIDCVATPAIAGSNCNINTTLDTLVPGTVVEGKRAVVSVGSIEVQDAGADGSVAPDADPLGLGCPPTCGSGDETVFEREGLFTP